MSWDLDDVSQLSLEEKLCWEALIEFAIAMARFNNETGLLDQKRFNWKLKDFLERSFVRDDFPECLGEKATLRVDTHDLLWGRKFLEQHILFGGINFDPLLSSLVLYPLAGIVAIALSETCTAPLSRITILSQLRQLPEEKQGKSTILRQAARIIEQGGGGYEALWRGNLVSVAHRLTFYGVNFFAYLNFRALLESRVSMEPATVALVSGGLAALTAASVSHPLDTLRTCIALQTSKSYEGAWRTFCNVCKDDGFGSLYAGLSASLLGIVPSMAISVTVYECLLSKIRPKDSSLLIAALVCGSIAGLTASAATFPIDVVQRKMQSEDGKHGSGGRRRGVWQVFGQIIEKEGVAGLYKGIKSHCLKAVLGHATAFMTYEMVKIPLHITLRKLETPLMLQP